MGLHAVQVSALSNSVQPSMQQSMQHSQGTRNGLGIAINNDAGLAGNGLRGRALQQQTSQQQVPHLRSSSTVCSRNHNLSRDTFYKEGSPSRYAAASTNAHAATDYREASRYGSTDDRPQLCAVMHSPFRAPFDHHTCSEVKTRSKIVMLLDRSRSANIASILRQLCLLEFSQSFRISRAYSREGGSWTVNVPVNEPVNVPWC